MLTGRAVTPAEAVIGVDVGGTTTAGGLVDAAGRVLGPPRGADARGGATAPRSTVVLG